MMEQHPSTGENQPSYNSEGQVPAWEGGNTFPPPQQPLQQQQGYAAQYPLQGNIPPSPARQGQYEPQQQYSQQQPSYPQQWGNIQPPEGTLQPPPMQQSYPGQQWQQQPMQGNAGQAMYPPQMQQQSMYPPQMQQQMYPSQAQPQMMQQPMYPPVPQMMQQQPMYPYGQPQMMMPQQVVNVNIQQHQHGLFVRALYFFFIGWWAGLIWLNIGYFFVMTIIGLPIGLMMLNRLPVVLTLKPASQSINISITGNTTNITITGAQQVNFLIRALYFIFIGWWAGLLWSYVAYAMFVFILTIPVGVIMFNMLPTIITLRKN